MESKEFNINQIRPVLLELMQANDIIVDMIKCFESYVDFLKSIQTEIKCASVIKDEIRIKIDKHIDLVMENISSLINKENPSRKSGSKKESIFDRLSRGLVYKYKIDNNTIAENPEPLTIGIFAIVPRHKYININNTDYYLQDSFHFFMDKTDFCSTICEHQKNISYNDSVCQNNLEMEININVDMYTDKNIDIDSIINNINTEIKKINMIAMELNLYLIKVTTYITTINNDIKNFGLFDVKILLE